MIKVASSGPYCYIVTGENEKEAAEALEKKLDFFDYCAAGIIPSWQIPAERTEAISRIAEKYGVTIKTNLD